MHFGNSTLHILFLQMLDALNDKNNK